MSEPLHVLSASFTRARRRSQDTGLLGLASVVVQGDWILEPVAVRRHRTGSAYIAFPAKDDRRGRRSYPFRPSCERARREFEAQVLTLLAEDIAELEQERRAGAGHRNGRRRGRGNVARRARRPRP